MPCRAGERPASPWRSSAAKARSPRAPPGPEPMTRTERRPGTEPEDPATQVPDRAESRARARAQGVERAHGVTIDVRYVGHSTVRLDLSSLGGPRVLTDPFLRDRLGPLRRHGELPTP